MNKQIFRGLALAGTLALTAPLLVSAQAPAEQSAADRRAGENAENARVDRSAQNLRTDDASRRDSAPAHARTDRQERMHGEDGWRHSHAWRAMRGAHGEHGRHGDHGHVHGGKHGAPMMGHGGRAGGDSFVRHLRGLDLSEAQRDQLFELRHAQAPALREQGKIIRDARRELHALSMSDAYDEAKVNELSDRAAQAVAEMARLRARAGNEVWKLLTAEQREKLAERAARVGRHGGPGGA